jgi:flagellar hook assembly protein FlgD
VLDDNIEQPYILNDYYETAPNTYQRGYVNFQISGIANGKHTIRVKAWDVNNNSGEGTVDFVVMDGKIMGIENLMNYPNPFNGITHFVFEHNHPDEQLDVKINIYNTAGAVVKNIEEKFTPTGSRSSEMTWDGTDNSGTRLPSGVYVYRVLISTEQGFRSSAYQKLVIVR